MYKFKISKIILQKRKEKNITQKELAEYMKVTKASVSKWETGQSYPDILLLPKLATFSTSALMNCWDMILKCLKLKLNVFMKLYRRIFHKKTIILYLKSANQWSIIIIPAFNFYFIWEFF